MPDKAECNGRDYSVIVEVNGKTYLRADFDGITDLNAIVLMPVLQMVKELFPEAKIVWKRCTDEPLFAFPLYHLMTSGYRPTPQRFM